MNGAEWQHLKGLMAIAACQSERFLFQHLVRAQYLITHGFQLLADHKLTSEEWKQLRVNAKHRVSELVEGALAKHAQHGRERP